MSSAAQQVHIEHPIDLIEGLAASREWPFERGTEDDMNVCISGSHSDYHLAISWRPDLGGLHVGLCARHARAKGQAQ